MSRPGMTTDRPSSTRSAPPRRTCRTAILDAQAAGMVAAWQILEAGVNGAKSLGGQGRSRRG